MIRLDTIKDIIVFLLVYIPPLLVFAKFWREKHKNIIVLIIITLIYLGGSIFTQNLLPFILIIFDIKFIKSAGTSYLDNKIDNTYNKTKFGRDISSVLKFDYNRFKFNGRNFSIFSALKLSAISYTVSLLISIVETILLSRVNVKLEGQEVVSWMSSMQLWRFIIIIPVMIIFAPVVEEFVFRWLFFEKIFKNRMGIYLSALISSLIFGFAHFNLRSFPILVWIGIFNCYLIDKKGYWYSVFNHFTFNFITTMALLIDKI